MHRPPSHLRPLEQITKRRTLHLLPRPTILQHRPRIQVRPLVQMYLRRPQRPPRPDRMKRGLQQPACAKVARIRKEMHTRSLKAMMRWKMKAKANVVEKGKLVTPLPKQFPFYTVSKNCIEFEYGDNALSIWQYLRTSDAISLILLQFLSLRCSESSTDFAFKWTYINLC